MHFETAAPFSKRKESIEIPEERFFLTEQEVLGHLFDDEEEAASWLLENDGQNGELLREVTERHLRVPGNDPDIAENIAEELRSLCGTFREAV